MNSESFQEFSQSPNKKDSLLLKSFDDLLTIVAKQDPQTPELKQHEKVWENIPLVIPKSVIILDKEIKKVQKWCKLADGQINFLLSDTFTRQIKRDLEAQKIKEDKFEEIMKSEVASIHQEILDRWKLVDEAERKRIIRDEKEKVEEVYFSGFFEQDDHDTMRTREHKFIKRLENSEIPEEEYNEPRRYNIKQLHYIIYRLLDQSKLNLKVTEIDHEMDLMEKRLEEKMQKQYEEMNQKCLRLEERIKEEKEDLRQDLTKKDEAIIHYIEGEIMGRLAEDENAIKTTVDIMEELKEDIEENRNFREKASERLERMFKENNAFLKIFESKIKFYDENFETMKSKTEEKLAAFTDIIERKFMKLKEESDQLVLKMKEEVIKVGWENHQNYVEKVEKTLNKTTKDLYALDFETKRVLDSFKIDMSHFNMDSIKKCEEIEDKLDSFMSRFEAYAKTKIEPAFNNEAKVHALEAQFYEQEQFVSHATFFTRDILKKLIYAIQKHNLGTMKWLDDDEPPKPKKLPEIGPSVYMTEIRDTSTVGTENPPSQEDTPASRYTPHRTWRRKLNSSTGPRSIDRGGYPFLPLDATSTNVTGQSLLTLPNTAKSQKRRQSFDTEKQNISRGGDEGTPKQAEFDNFLHKRLEVLRRALVEESFITQKHTNVVARDITGQNKEAKETFPKNSFFKFYQDINLVKVTPSGVKRRHDKVANKTVSEFSDAHIFTETPEAGGKN